MSKFEDNLLLTVSAMGVNGEGIANVNDDTVFVPFALPNEKIAARVTYRKGNLLYARVKKIIAASPYRVDAPCNSFGICGGCRIMHLQYGKQLEFKREIVQRNLKKIAAISFEVAQTVASPQQLNYRNKAVLPVAEQDGLKIGFFEEGSHKVVNIDRCPLHGQWLQDVIQVVRLFCKQYGISGYNEQNNCGILRHVVARKLKNHCLITAVINADDLPHKHELYNMLVSALGNVTLYLNVNKKKTNAVTGETYAFVDGKAQLNADFLGINVPISPGSFAQINDDVRDLLYSHVLNNCGLTDVAVDAYAGAGALTALLAARFDKVYGIEIFPQAVDDANLLMKNNGINNVINSVGDCARVLPTLLESLTDKSITLVLDPPRKGADKAVCEAVLKARPQRIIYISCNSATLARDLNYLGASGDSPTYELISVTPFDMFPQTSSIETVAVLGLKEGKGKIV